MNIYYVYILQSGKDNQWYTGYSDDLKRRLKEHKRGECFSTKNRRPLELIYFEEAFEILPRPASGVEVGRVSLP